MYHQIKLKLVLIPLFLSILVISGCSRDNSKNDSTSNDKYNTDYALMIEFEAKNTLRLPEPYGLIKEDFLIDKKTNLNNLIVKEKIEAGIAKEDVQNWEYITTEVKFYNLEFMSDVVAEKSVMFKNSQNERSILFDSVYYMDKESLEWKILKSSITNLVVNKESQKTEILKINNKSIQYKTIWKCGELNILCTEADNAKSWGL